MAATFTADASYSGQTASNSLTVSKAQLSVKADDKSKAYDGAVFTGFTSTISGFVSGQTEAGLRGSGALTGAAAYSGAGTTAVSASATPYVVTPTLGTLTATNYTFAFLNGNLTISNRAITVTADAKTKTYGDPDPALTYQVTSGSLNAGDSFSGTLTRVAGTSVGTYAIQQGTLTAGANYTLTFVQPTDDRCESGDGDGGGQEQDLRGRGSGADLHGERAQRQRQLRGQPGADRRRDRRQLRDRPGHRPAGPNYTITFVGANLTITAQGGDGDGGGQEQDLRGRGSGADLHGERAQAA